MKITEISVRLGETVNLGNYSNFRPEISATAELGLGENPNRAIEQLTRTVQEQLAELVDDALEQAEMDPKYASRVFRVRINYLRGVVVVFEKGLKLPEEKTWRDTDKWEQESGLSHYMRQDTAMVLAERVEQSQGLSLYLIEYQEDMDTLPSLPDPGPEPLWSKRGLKTWLERLSVPESEWDMLAALPHVTPEHINAIYRHSPFSTYDKLKDGILAVPVTHPEDNEDNDDRPENERFPDNWDEEE